MAREGLRGAEASLMLSVRQVAGILGCHSATVWRHVANGTLPKPIRIGGLTRWSASEIEAAIERANSTR